jgi:ABC-type branched-subunit amino acid transport system substrate-binding protein
MNNNTNQQSRRTKKRSHLFTMGLLMVVFALMFSTSGWTSVLGRTESGSGDYPSSGMVELDSISIPKTGWTTNDEASAPRFMLTNQAGTLAYIGTGGSEPYILVYRLSDHALLHSVHVHTGGNNVGTLCSGQLVAARNELWITARARSGNNGQVVRMTLDGNGTPSIASIWSLDGQPANYDMTTSGPRAPFTIQHAVIEREVRHYWEEEWWDDEWWWWGWYDWYYWGFWWEDDGSWLEVVSANIWVGVFTVDMGNNDFRVEVRALQETVYDFYEEYYWYDWLYEEWAHQELSYEWELMDQSATVQGNPKEMHTLDTDPLYVAVVAGGLNGQARKSQIQGFIMWPSSTSSVNMSYRALSPVWERSLSCGINIIPGLMALACPTGNDTNMVVAAINTWSHNREYEVRLAPLVVDHAVATFNQPDYNVKESADGLLYDRSNGWAVYNSALGYAALPQSAAFVFNDSQYVSNVVLNMDYGNRHEIRDFYLYYTTDVNPSLTGSWLPLTAGLSFVNTVSGAGITGNHITVDTPDQMLYELQFNRLQATAIKLEVHQTHAENHNFVLSEIEFSDDTMVGCPVVMGPVSPIIAEISGLAGHVVFAANNGEGGAYIDPLFIQSDSPTNGSSLPGLQLTDTNANIVTGAAATNVGPLYMVTRNRNNTNDDYQLQKVGLSPESAIRAYKVELDHATYPAKIHYYSHNSHGTMRLAIYSDSGGHPDSKIWESHEIVNDHADVWRNISISDNLYIDNSYVHSNVFELPVGTYWLAWQYDGPAVAGQDAMGYIPDVPGKGYEVIHSYGTFPGTLGLPAEAHLTSDNWALNLTSVDFVVHMGGRINPPAGADASRAPIISPTFAAFYHGGEQACFANYDILVSLSWYDGGGNTPSSLQEIGVVLPAGDHQVRKMLHHIQDIIDLSRSPGYPQVHYNPQIQWRVFDASNVTSQYPDAWVDHRNSSLMLPDAQYVDGDFVLTFESEINGVTKIKAVEVVRVIPPSKLVAEHGQGKCGHQLLPVSLPSDVALTRAQVLVGDDPANRYVYLNNTVGADKGKVYAVQPVSELNRHLAKVVFFEEKSGAEWPYQITDYHLEWPSVNERIIHIADSLPVDLTGNGYYQDHVEWLYNQGNHGHGAGNQFEAHGAGSGSTVRAVIALWHPDEQGDGSRIQMAIIDSYDHNDTIVMRPEHRRVDWKVGTQIEDDPVFYDVISGTQCADCGSGYIYVSSPSAEQDLFYDADIHGSTIAHAGPIFPVNEGELEVWWYHQKKDICWPYRAKRYYSTWDSSVPVASATTDASLAGYEIANTIDGATDATGLGSGWAADATRPAMGIWTFDRPHHIGSAKLYMNNSSTEQIKDFTLFYTGDAHPRADGNWMPIVEKVSMRNLNGFITGVTPTITDGRIEVNVPGQNVYHVSFRPQEMTGLMMWVYDDFPGHNFVLTEIEFFQEISLTSQGEYPVELDETYSSVNIYEQSDRSLPGYKPNMEHAQIMPGETTLVYALRNDLNPPVQPKSSRPYVLVKYRRNDQWGMNLYRVYKGDLTYRGTAGAFVAPPYPLNAEGSCKDAKRYVLDGAWVDPDGGVWLARGPSSSTAEEVTNGYASVEIGYYEAWQGACTPWLVPSSRPPIRTYYQSIWPEFTQPSCAPGTQDCFTTLYAGDSVLRPGFSSARIIYNDAGLALIDNSKNWNVSLFRLPIALLPTFPDLRHDIRENLSYDSTLLELKFKGIMTGQEQAMIKAMPGANGSSDDELAFRDAVDQLFYWSNSYKLESLLVELPACFSADLHELGSSLNDRLDYDPARKQLTWIKPTPAVPGNAVASMSTTQRSAAKATCLALTTPDPTWTPTATWTPAGAHVTPPPTPTHMPTPTPKHIDWYNAIDDLYTQSNNPHTYLEGGQITVSAGGVSLASGAKKWASIAFTDSHMVEIFRVECPPAAGELQVLLPDCFFDERQTLHWTGDGGGKIEQIYFHWQVSEASGSRPAGDYDENFWIDWPAFTPGQDSPPSGGKLGANDLTVGGPGIFTVADHWYRVRYRLPGFCDGMWSNWTEPKLGEGWIKRVIAGLNLFDQRIDVNDPTTQISTFSDVIQQLGPRFERMVALNCSPAYVNQLGLIEAYQTVLLRAESYTIDAVPPVADNDGVNHALLLMAGKLASYYTILADEAYGDAADPTIGLGGGITDVNASSLFSFKDQVASLLEENLALLRGTAIMDEGDVIYPRDPDPLVTHIYNKLPWNFTLGDGEITYVHNYNILDIDEDGDIDSRDALLLYPQGHGDAWGHYLTSLKYYYDLMRHPRFKWSVLPEAVNVNGRAVSVSYQHERAFAQLAAKKAQAAQSIINQTYRSHWVDDPTARWQGYRDSNSERAWGFSEWSRRAASGALFDWTVANAVLPASDTNPEHQGTISQVDRTTTGDLVTLAETIPAIQAELDRADQGNNPLGLDNDVVSFAIDPNQLDAGVSHFEQVYEKAVQSVQNAQVVFNFANQSTQKEREQQDTVWRFQGNVIAEELAWIDQLIHHYGSPYTDDIGIGKTYPEEYEGPDLYHFYYCDATPLYLETVEPTFSLQANVRDHHLMMIRFASPRKNKHWPTKDDWDEQLKYDYSYDLTVVNPAYAGNIDFNFSAIGLGTVKPDSWVGTRRSPGEIQYARDDVLEQYGNLRSAMEEFKEYNIQIDANYSSLKRHLEYRNLDHAANKAAHEFIYSEKAANYALEVIAKEIEFGIEVAKDYVEASEELTESLKNPVFVTDLHGVLKSAIKVSWGVFKWTLLGIAKQLEIFTPGGTELAITNREQELAKLLEYRSIDDEMRSMLKEYAFLANESSRRTLQLYTQMEGYFTSLERYSTAVDGANRTLKQYLAWRKRIAANVALQRYEDLGYRVFRNDVLEKFDRQLEIASRYVYLAARAYDYETCLLSSDALAGQQFLTDIVKHRNIGYFDDGAGTPEIGSGLCDTLARMKQNFDFSIKPALGINNPDVEGNRISLRWELMRIPQESEYDDLWESSLQNAVVSDVQLLPEFQEHCLYTWGESINQPQPAIVLRFSTLIEPGKNFFGRPLGQGDNAFSSSHFATKIRRLGLWLSNYNETADVAGLASTPRAYLVPIGMDVMRVPTINPGQPRYWNLVDQVLPMPYPIDPTALIEDRDWSVWEQNFRGRSSFTHRRKFADMRAYSISMVEAGEPWDILDWNNYITSSRAVGRSVWNTEWLLVIPGINLNADPIAGLQGFIYGNGADQRGIKDIQLFFDTYSYQGSEPGKAVAPSGQVIAQAKAVAARVMQSAASSNEPDMPPMIIYGEMVSANDGGRITSGNYTGSLEFHPLEAPVEVSGLVEDLTGALSYRAEVSVVAQALGEMDCLQRYERYHAAIGYQGHLDQHAQADLPPADYGVAFRMTQLEVPGVFSGSPTYTPTTTYTPTHTPTPTATPTSTSPLPPTATLTPTWTATFTPTPTGTSTATPTATYTPTSTATPWPQYRVQAVLPLTGLFSEYGLEARRGAQLAVEDINRTGGINGVPLELVYHNNESTSQGSIDGFQAALDDTTTFAVVGAQASANTLAMAPMAAPNTMPLFTSSGAQQLSQYEDYVVKVAPLDHYQVEAIYQCLQRISQQQIVVLAENSAYGLGFLQNLIRHASVEVVRSHTYNTGALDLGAALGELKGQPGTANTGIIAGYVDDVNQFLVAAAADPELNGWTWILTDAAAVDEVIPGLPRAFWPQVKGISPSVVGFLDTAHQNDFQYQLRYGVAPGAQAYFGYDTVLTLAQALAVANDKNPIGIWRAIPGLYFTGVTGVKQYDAEGELVHAVYDGRVISEGRFVTVSHYSIDQPAAGTSAKASLELSNNADDDGLVFNSFIQSLPGSHPSLGHIEGSPDDKGAWIVEPGDMEQGESLAAYSQDVNRLDDRGQRFGYADGEMYFLTFDFDRTPIGPEGSPDDVILQLIVKSVCHYIDESSHESISTNEMLRYNITFADWPTAGQRRFVIPVRYASAAPGGYIATEVGNKLKWDLYLMREAQQMVALQRVTTWSSPINCDMDRNGRVDEHDLVWLHHYINRADLKPVSEWLLQMALTWHPASE